MTPALSEFAPLLPEIFVLTMTCAVLLIDLFLTDQNRYISYLLALVTMGAAAVITFAGIPVEPEVVLSGTYINDQMGSVLKIFVFITYIK